MEFIIGLLMFLLIVCLGVGFYFLPFLVALANKDCHNLTAIFFLNLLAGWTFIGWVAALVMALWQSAPKTLQPIIQVPPVPAQPDFTGSPVGLSQIIRDSEYSPRLGYLADTWRSEIRISLLPPKPSLDV